ncbi:MAG: hypothetical protein RBG13Loki_3970, partial [Promethearchaeota archaeon CR_4]
FGGTLYSVIKEPAPIPPRAVNLQWNNVNRLAESDAYQIQFNEEGQITQIYDRLLRISLLFNRTASLFSHKKPTFKVLENGPIRMVLEIRGKAAVTRMTLSNRDRCIIFETEVAKDPQYVRWWPQGEQLKVFVDFPFGLEETQCENLTGLNFALIQGKSPVVFQIGNFGLQNYFFLPADIDDKALEGKLNSRTLRTGDIRVMVMLLPPKQTHRYFLHIAPHPFSPAAAYQVLLQSTQKSTIAFLETPLKPAVFPTFSISNPNMVVTSCRVTKERTVELRLVNYSAENGGCTVKLPQNSLFKNVETIDLTGTVLENIPISSREISLNFHSWEFKTIRFG